MKVHKFSSWSYSPGEFLSNWTSGFAKFPQKNLLFGVIAVVQISFLFSHHQDKWKNLHAINHSNPFSVSSHRELRITKSDITRKLGCLLYENQFALLKIWEPTQHIISGCRLFLSHSTFTSFHQSRHVHQLRFAPYVFMNNLVTRISITFSWFVHKFCTVIRSGHLICWFFYEWPRPSILIV